MKRSFPAAQLTVACITFLVLTATIMYREGRDGYQATHLLFMPRETWGVDAGRRMLHEEEHHDAVDALQPADKAVRREIVPSSAAYGSPVPQAGGPDGHLTSQSNIQGKAAIHPRAHVPSHEGNTPPLANAQLATSSGSGQFAPVEVLAFCAKVWHDDVPTPPPRAVGTM
jgi:hypothetical protein